MTDTHPRIPTRLVRGALIGVGGINALSAIGGGIGLLTPGSMGIPIDVIAGSGFTSYVWPAILLIVVIGGTQLLAVITEVRRAAAALFWAAFAGFAMIIWIFVELAVMGGFSALHGIYFASGTLQLILVFALLGIAPSVVGAELSRAGRAQPAPLPTRAPAPPRRPR